MHKNIKKKPTLLIEVSEITVTKNTYANMHARRYLDVNHK